jgi:hypothetical protein
MLEKRHQHFPNDDNPFFEPEGDEGILKFRQEKLSAGDGYRGTRKSMSKIARRLHKQRLVFE